jgi:hypothetical protein
MKSPLTWFAVLVAVCVGGPYLLNVRPRTRAQWAWLAITITFLAWILPLMGSVRSR